MQSQDANTGLISNFTASIIRCPHPLIHLLIIIIPCYVALFCYSHSSIKHPSIYFFISPFTHNLHAYICNIYDSSLHAYRYSHFSIPLFYLSVYPPSFHSSIYPFIYIYLLQHPSKYIDSYIIISTLSDVHPVTHKATHSKISPLYLSWIRSSFLLIQIFIQPGYQFIQSQIALKPIPSTEQGVVS